MKHNHRKNKFRLRLFWAFTLLFTATAFMVSLLFFRTNNSSALQNERLTSNIVLDRIAAQLTFLYSQMDIAATSITKNSSIQQNILNLNSAGGEAGLSPVDALQMKKNIQHRLTNMMFSSHISNVILYDSQYGYFYYTGLYLGDRQYIRQALEEDDAAERLKISAAPKLMKGPHQSPWMKEKKTVLSVIRGFSDNSTTKSTLVEIQVPYSQLDAICRQDTFGQEKEIVLLDRDNHILYPCEGPVSVLSPSDFGRVLADLAAGRKEHSVKDYSFYSSDIFDGEFRLLLLSNNRSMESSFTSNLKIAAVTFFVMLLPTLAAVFTIISVISRPLQELIKHINRISLDKETKLQLPVNTLDEFEIINASFNQMLENMRESVKQTYEAKIRETNARLTALQAQINPHFLYNALNSISAASEVYGSEVTTKMCQEFSSMMRYITSGSQQVKLISEIGHTKNYLDFMKISYDGDFDYAIELPLTMYNIVLPKLIIQPLVENSFKHGFKNAPPPWRSSIRCYVQDTFWIIEISDNGGGFSAPAAEEFSAFRQEYLSHSSPPPYEGLEIGGLGLKNIFGRLMIYFNDTIEMSAENQNGAVIRIRGILRKEEGMPDDDSRCS